jgi:hypothetical protein
MGMLRNLSNKLQGRKKVQNEHLNFQEVLNQLGSLSEETNVNIIYGLGSMYFHLFKDKKPKEAAQIIEKRFDRQQEKFKYFEADHETFSGEKTEKHYLWLKNGFINSKSGLHYFPYQDASVNYIVEKAINSK